MPNSFGLSVVGDAPIGYTSGRDYLAALRLDDGFALPESFQRFAAELGYGVLLGDLVVDVPFERNPGCCPALTATLAGTRAALLSSIEFVEPDEQPLYRRLLPFGRAGYGPQLCWDPQLSTGSGGEVAVYVAWDNTAWRLGDTFDEMIERLTRDQGARPFGRSYPRIFKPYARCQAIHMQLAPAGVDRERRLELLLDAVAPASRGVCFDLDDRFEQRVELQLRPADKSARATLSYTECRGAPEQSLWLSTTLEHEDECVARLHKLLALPEFRPTRVYDIAGDDTWGLMT